MASNYNNQNDANDPMLDEPLDSNASRDDDSQAGRYGSHGLEFDLQEATSDFKVTTPPNDAQLLRMRRVNFNRSLTRTSFELMCEDRASKYKLEEVHCSLPSSNKSTFIMTFSPDGQRVASTHGDHRIYICDLTTGKLLDTLEGHPKTPWCLAWHPSNREILASGCLAGEVRVWDLRSRACELWVSENNTIITSVDFHPKERVLVIATSNAIHFWDWSESEPFAKATTAHDKEKVKFVGFDSSGTKLITGISNLPKFAGYSSDSLQSRIIDSYLSQGTLDQIPTENMTQNSEITGTSLSGPLNSETLNQRISASQLASSSSPQRLLVSGTNSNITNNTIDTEQDLSYRSTMTLSRIAFLYRQLEALEDSMRHTSFVPYVSPRANSSTQTPPIDLNRLSTAQQSCPIMGEEQSNSIVITNEIDQTTREIPPMQPQQTSSSQSRIGQAPNTVDPQSSQPNGRTPSAFEPFVVSFDEFLVQLHLSPLMVNGQIINPAAVVDHYPLETPTQSNYMMQFDSINQTNQNYIRISKLMSSVRLYRQVVQQILTSSTGQGHYQPSQILTAQSAPRFSRNTSTLPIIFRSFPASNPTEPSSASRALRSDPVLAIQFRNSARNVPLVTICRIDLLSARCVCIMRSQQLIEQAASSLKSSMLSDQEQVADGSSDSAGHRKSMNSGRSASQAGGENNSSCGLIDSSDDASAPFYPLLNQLHQSLTNINHAPLTTSNVHTHIVSIRGLLNRLLTTLSSMFNSRDDGARMIRLIHDIAHSLTGRSWNIPLGATLDDIRLDVINALCIVDLTLHLARQVQLLQMQRFSALTKIEDNRRITAITGQAPSTSSLVLDEGTSQSIITNPISHSLNPLEPATSSREYSDDFIGPGTSREATSGVGPSCKRKGQEASLSESFKRIKTDVDWPMEDKPNTNSEKVDVKKNVSSADPAATPRSNYRPTLNSSTESPASMSQSSSSLLNSTPDALSADRMLVWNNSQSVGVEHSLHRFLVAAATSMSQYNSHILVRIYSRLQGGQNVSALSNGPGQSAADRHPNHSPESRRRALSQDNSRGTQDVNSAGNLTPTATSNENSRARPLPLPIVYPVADLNGGGFSYDSWQRHPHLHVYQTRGTGQHLWFNQWTIPLPVSNSNYRLQCWNFSLSAIPSIQDSQLNLLTQKCRIHNDSSIDISSNGFLIACLVPRDEGNCLSNFDLKIFSLRSIDFGACYHQLPHGPNAISVSLSPSANYAVVGLVPNKFITNDNDSDLTIAKIFKLNVKHSTGYIRDIKIKRNDLPLNLNAIRWMSRGIIYNIGPKPFRHRSEVGAQQ